MLPCQRHLFDLPDLLLNPDAYADPPDLSVLDDIGLPHRSTPLLSAIGHDIDPERLAEILVSMAREPDARKGHDD